MKNKEGTTMKKFMTDIKTLAALFIAGYAFTACSSDDNFEQPENPVQKTYTLTVNASKEADTRALSFDGEGKLNATWTEGEKVLVYQNGSKIGTLTAAASSTAETTLSGTLVSAPATDQDLTFYFHTNANPSYSSQDGTLTKIASTYDFCAPATVASGSFTVDAVNHKVDVPAGITFGANKQAIVKFAFVDKADNTIKLSPSAIIASLDVSPSAPEYMKTMIQSGAASAGVTLPYENNITIPAATYTENGEGVIYLAIPDKLEAIPMFKNYFDFTLTATVGSDTYTLTKSGFPFSNGQYYEITAKMTKQASATSSATTGDVGKVIGADGKIYANATAATEASTTAVAMIAYVGSATGETSFTHGLALAMSDANSGNKCFWATSIPEENEGNEHEYTNMNKNNFATESGLQYNDESHNSSTHPAFQAAISNNSTTKPTGCSDWFLPTGYQFNQMINAAGSLDNLINGFSSVGGTNMQSSSDSYYWVATEFHRANAWLYKTGSGNYMNLQVETTPG